MSDRGRDTLVEAAATPHREQDVEGRLVPPPAWWDLAPEAREELFRRQWLSRLIERATNPAGRSSTVQAVMHRIWG